MGLVKTVDGLEIGYGIRWDVVFEVFRRSLSIVSVESNSKVIFLYH